uniref:Reverse transcriptase domain-containing protein n=1 Tax=Knipowitschia caucasica TaxID=637954 RepID=A0AAV2J7R2_KNICA
MSVLKVKGLSAPFSGIRQGCSLSGMLYSLSIEPLLHRLRADLQGALLPGAVSANADDIMVFINSLRNIEVLADTVQCFGQVSSSKVNWSKSSATLRYSGRRRRGQLLSFLIGQAKLAVYVSRRRKAQDQSEVSVRVLLVRIVQARLRREFGL